MPALEGEEDFDAAVSSHPVSNIIFELLCPDHLCARCSNSFQKAEAAAGKRKRGPLARTRSGNKGTCTVFSSHTPSEQLENVFGSVKYIKIEDGKPNRDVWFEVPKTHGECAIKLGENALLISSLKGEKKQSTRDHYCTDRFAKHLISEALSGKIFPNAKALGQAAYNRFRNEEFNKSDIWSISDFIMETIGEEVEVFENEFLKTLKDGSS